MAAESKSLTAAMTDSCKRIGSRKAENDRLPDLTDQLRCSKHLKSPELLNYILG